MCVVKQKGYRSRLAGSPKFLCKDNHIFAKSYVIKENASVKEEKKVKKVKAEEKPKTQYGLRKSKIRNKILNFFNLNKSKKFCAFYSISFPVEIEDNIAYKVLNTWLTRCRKESGLDEAEKNNKLILENERLKKQISNLKAVLKEVL